MRSISFFCNALLFALFSSILGCSVSSSSPSGTIGSVRISGRVHGGQQPVSGATIQLYAVGTSGDGSASTPLLTQTVTTGSDGTFSITSLYACNNASLVYLTAIGGDPGIGSRNSNLAEMTALGPCSSLTASTFISVNEVTTVAAVYALAPFMKSITAIGSSSTDASTLTSAFALASQLADPVAGTSPGNGVPSGATIPSALINTLANVISTCINSAGGTASTPTLCGRLFALTTPGNSAAPTNTVSSLLYLANNPTLNTALLYSLAPAIAPFQPSLTSTPPDFRITAVPSSPMSLQITPSQLTFPISSVGVASSPQSVTIQNITGSTVTLSSLTLSGANAADFTSTNNCTAPLAPGASCNAQVTITPSAAGSRIGYLNIASDAPASPQFVTLTINNPIPSISSFGLPFVPAGSTTPLNLLVVGSNFLPSSIVQVNGSNRLTGYLNSSYLEVQLTVADQATAGSLSITVVNPTPGGGTSAPATFTVTPPATTPIISQVSPTQLTANSTSTYIYVYGSNLVPGETVQWNGMNLPTGYGFNTSSGYYLVGTVAANLLAAAGTASITVDNTSTTPPVSNVLSVSIVNPPPPTLTSLSTTLAPINTNTTITLSGTGFTPTSTVALNGVKIPTSSIYTTQIRATIPASAIATPGVYTLTVSTPFGTSAPLDLTVYVPIINNSMVYNPVNRLFYLSVPSAAGAPYGNSIVPVDPVTGALGTPILVGSEPNRMAITSDGRYLWVALDGAAAVRKVDLVAGAAGLQFSIGSSDTVAALAALPGATDSVVVSTYYGGYTTPTGISLTIYDAGVARSSNISFATYAPFPWVLIVDGTKNEIYGPGQVFTSGGVNYNTYRYDSTGITLLNSTAQSGLIYAQNNTDDVQIAGGRLYTSFGQAVDPESGSLLGTFYSTGTTVAQGSVTVDTALGKAFVLEGSAGAFGGATGTISSTTAQLGAFNTSDFSATSSTPIPISIPVYRASYQYAGPTGSRLTRWGSNGLAVRGTGGFISLRTAMVQDLSAVNADLNVALTSSGTNTTGSTTTYTATVTNNGPAAASSVELTAFLPSTGTLTSATPSSGSCSTAGSVLCNLGSLADGASTTVTFNVLQTSAGSATLTVQASASETDPVPSNNQATSTVNVTGSAYNVAPTLSAISPAAIVSGSSDTVITLTGSGFSISSTVLLNGTSLVTNFVSTTQLTATVPATYLTTLGWAPISVSSPAPGGGTSSPVPLTVFSVLNVGASHILYDPYSRKIMASVGTGTSSVAGNSIVAITPDNASIGTAVPIGGTPPTRLALTSDGQILYALLPSSTTGSIARFNMLTQQPDFTVSGFQATGYELGLDGIAAQPGTENTIAVDEGQYIGMSIFDFDPASKTAARRGVATGIYQGGPCIVFPNASSLFLTGGSTLNTYSVTSNGLVNGSYPYYVSSNLQNFGCSKLDGGILYAGPGGVANANVYPAVQLGTFEGLMGIVNGITIGAWAPDTSLGLSFYLTDANPNDFSGIFDSITAFSNQTFMPTATIPLPVTTIEGTTSVTGVDVVRWGQDGVAILSSGGRVYLIRGAAIVPQLLNVNSAAVITASSLTSTIHGTGNLSLTLTGSNFVPGVAVLWNGSCRTTTIVDSTHVSVAIPASDFAQAGTAMITAVNPGATASDPLTFSIN